MAKNYSIGLDIGTNSVGWAVIETDTQKIIKKGKNNNRKALWGVCPFNEAQTAAQRREFRSTKRTYDRRRNRIKLLQAEFKSEIENVDSEFFKKLQESKYHELDKENKTILLTKEEKRKIKEYNAKYPTIYHLRKRLMEDKSKEDIRLVYLAIHHIIKYRGNFLQEGSNFNVQNLNVEEKLVTLLDLLIEQLPNLNISDDYLQIVNLNEFQKALTANSKNDIKTSVKLFFEKLTLDKKFISNFQNLVVGNKFSIQKLFDIEMDKDIKLSFNSSDFDEKYDELENILNEKIEILQVLKDLYDMLNLKRSFKNSNNCSISNLMVEKYDQHHKDLRFLKQVFDNDRIIYDELFRSNDKKICLYEEYLHNKILPDEFCKKIDGYINKVITSCKVELQEKYKNYVQNELINNTFMPRITEVNNGSFPYQLNKIELINIIKNQGQYYPFLLEKVNDQFKIVKLLEFKIPYYVGPLNKNSNFAWFECKDKNTKITPYNFDEVIDKNLTAEKFIKRMISHCTYLQQEPALPNNSILYSKYKVLNELKQIKVNDRKMPFELQKKVFKDLFMKTKGNITDNILKKYLENSLEYSMENNLKITGYSSDKKFANNLKSYCDFIARDGIFKDTNYTIENAEEIIEWITIFEDKEILKNKLLEKYSKLSENKVNDILKLKYKGWGRISNKLLTTKYYNDKSIIDLLEETEENFMQIINNDKYNFQKMIKENNEIKNNIKISADLIKDLATSPAVKRGVYQAIKIVQELIDLMGDKPKNIIIEMPRSKDLNPKRTLDKKSLLLKIYNENNFKRNNKDLYNKLNKLEKVDSLKLYLYFMQEGKCLYTGTPLEIENLNDYEIDHILPQTLIKDDSIDNKALVLKECNQIKSASFVLPKEYRNDKNKKWWQHLLDMKLISAKKMYRLTRNEYKDEDIQGFINRQLVETSQITKHVAHILENVYHTNIIYLKAKLTSSYRERYELFKFRDINDYHHAHDAYLAAVLGEYKEKYMKKQINFDMVKEMNEQFRNLGSKNKLKYGFVINSLDDEASNIVNEISHNLIDEETGEVLFNAKEFNKTVEYNLYRNDIMISRKAEIITGQFYKQSIKPKGKGTVPLKKNMPVKIYGGYTNVQSSYCTLIEYNNNKKLVGIPVEIAQKAKTDINHKINFIKEHLNVSEFTIIKDKITFETLIIFKNHPVYIKGYSVANKDFEVSNARQLKIPKEKLIRWKYILNEILNNKKTYENIDDKTRRKLMLEIIEYLYSQKTNYPLFINAITNIENNILLENKTIEELKNIIKQLFIIYQCKSVYGNLKEFGLKDNIGRRRLSGSAISKGVIISKSITGTKESKYEF